MAIIDTNIKGICMIDVVIISNDSTADMALLSQQSDMNVSAVLPTTLEDTLKQVGQSQPSIIVIEHGIANSSADFLCHYVSKQYPNSRCLMLIRDKPSFEMLQNSGFKARGYLTLDQRSILDRAIRVIQDGEAWLPRKLVTEMLNRFASSFIMPDEIVA